LEETEIPKVPSLAETQKPKIVFGGKSESLVDKKI
jgi:hypothetical protein